MSDEQNSGPVAPERPESAASPMQAGNETSDEGASQSEAVPVLQRVPSSASPTQQPESAPEVDKEPLPLADAVRALLIFVKGRRIVGDADLDAAIADVETELSAQDEQA